MPSTRVPFPIARWSGTHAAGRPRAQSAQRPHDGAQESTTSSPTATDSTSVADVLDDAGAFVPEHHRHRTLPLSPHLVQVGAADPDGGHADDDVVRARLGQVQLDDLERLADRPKQPGPCGEIAHRELRARARSDASAL